jgi:hypothetical protein
MKMAVFWVVALCRLVEVYQCLMMMMVMEVAGTSEALVNFYQNTWRYNPEDSVFLKLHWLKVFFTDRRLV